MKTEAYGVLVARMAVIGISRANAVAPQEAVRSTWQAECNALASTDFSTVVDAPTQVMTVRSVDATGDVPAYCQLQGYVVPQVGFLLALPASGWNGKFWEWGCGGDCGNDVSGYAITCAVNLHPINRRRGFFTGTIAICSCRDWPRRLSLDG